MVERGRRIRSVAALAVLLATMLCAAPPAGATTVGTPLGPDPAFVASAYHDFLGRVPHGVEWDAAGYEDLSASSGRARVVSVLASSPEWVTRTVQKMYQDTLGRPGDPGGVAYWVSMIRSGRLSVARVAAMLYSSSEYYTKYAGSDLRTWVGDLYIKLLLRPGSSDPGGVDYWTATAARRGRTAVAYAFFQSSESRHVRVEALYQTLLGRAPDVAGWNFWAARIQSSGDLALASSLAASTEYDARAPRSASRTPDREPGGCSAWAPATSCWEAWSSVPTWSARAASCAPCPAPARPRSPTRRATPRCRSSGSRAGA